MEPFLATLARYSDDPNDLRLHLEALDRLDDNDKAIVKALLDAILLRADAKRWTHAS